MQTARKTQDKEERNVRRGHPTPSTPKKVARVIKDQEPVTGDWGDIADWAEEMNRESLWEEDVGHTAGAPIIGSKDYTEGGLSH